MAILTALQNAAVRLVGRRPSVFFSSTDQLEQELVDLSNEVAQDICKYTDWQGLTSIYQLPADGVTEDFDFPADYDRMLMNSDIQDLNNWAWGYEHITDINQFMYRRARGFEPFPGGWIVYGGQFHFSPAPGATGDAAFPYISKNYARSSGGTRKAAFTADDDDFLIDERLLTLGLVWRWRENKKIDYTGDMENFTQLIDQLSAKDRGSRIIRGGRGIRGGNFSLAYPWALGGV